MFYIVEVQDYVRVEPRLFGLKTSDAVAKQLQEIYANYHDKEIGEGKTRPCGGQGDRGIYADRDLAVSEYVGDAHHGLQGAGQGGLYRLRGDPGYAEYGDLRRNLKIIEEYLP